MARYFTSKETAGVDPVLVDMADEARHIAGIPFVITCGLRTPESNANASGVTDSAHLTGNAMDFRVEHGGNLLLMISAFLQVGIKRIVIGIKSDGKTIDEYYHNVHIDNDSSKPHGIFVKDYARKVA